MDLKLSITNYRVILALFVIMTLSKSNQSSQRNFKSLFKETMKLSLKLS